MATFRVHKTSNYTVMSNHHLRDKELSLKGKGLLSVMLSLPEDWDYSINGLSAISQEGTKAIRNILQELENKGYLTRTRRQGTGGRFEYDYDIYEHPQPQDPQPHTHKGHTVEGHAEEGIQINTNILNTELLNTEELNKEIKELKDKRDKIDKRKIANFSPEEPSPFTKELIKGGYITEEDLSIREYNEYFNELLESIDYEIVRSTLWYFIKRNKGTEGTDANGSTIENKFAYFKNSMDFNTRKIVRINEQRENSDHWLFN